MGIFPKYFKPTANCFRAAFLLGWLANGPMCFGDMGPSALERGDYATAAAEFTVRANSGDAIAQNNLGVLNLKGQGVPQDYHAARRWFEAAAQNHLAGAMFNLGIIYLRGYGVPIDMGLATNWFERGALAGDREAQFFFGLSLYHGRGIEKNLSAAARWFRDASQQQLGAAQFNLAMMHLRGEAVAQNEATALELLTRAAANGHEPADLAIGQLHLAHLDDPDRAAAGTALFKRLAESGNVDAQVTLGLLYTFGQGTVGQDFEEGRFWLKLASNQGSGAAQLNLGNIFSEGLGVERDLVRAYAWYKISADNGDSAGVTYRDTLGAELSDAQIEQADALVPKLVAAKPTLPR